jgi:cytochrome c biogenesis protein CcdA
MLAGSIGHKLRPFFIVLGSSITFTLMGGAFAAIGLLASGVTEYMRLFFIFFIIAFGAVMVDEDINKVYTKYATVVVNRLLSRKGSNSSRNFHPLVGAFVLGLSLGIVWIPCVGPILGAVLAYASTTANLAKGSLLLMTYSFGLGLPMLGIAYGGKYASVKVEWVKVHSITIRKIAGWVIILTGIAMLFGLDRLVQAGLTPYFPSFEERLLK